MVNITISTYIFYAFCSVCFMASIKFANNSTKIPYNGPYNIKLEEQIKKDLIVKMLLDVG